MTIGREISSNTPALVVRTQGSDRSLAAGRTYSVGRNPESDIVIDEARVSWRHAVLRLEGSTWLLEDVGSTNGTFLGTERVKRVEITKDCVLRLGHPDDGQRLWCSIAAPPRDATAVASPIREETPPTTSFAPPLSAAPPSRPAVAPFQAYQPQSPPAQQPPPQPQPAQQPPAQAYQPPAQPYQPPAQAPRSPARPAAQAYPEAGARPYPPAQPGGSSIFRQPSAIMRLPSRVLRIGRATDNEIVVSDLSVSRYHAELRRDSRGGYEIADLSSHNGTYVNGQRIPSAPVTEAGIVTASGLLSPVTAVGDVLGTVLTKFHIINGVEASIPTVLEPLLAALLYQAANRDD